MEQPKSRFTVTVHGYQRLADELERLQGRRGEVAGNIRTAKAYGDLKENFEYHEAKREQGFVEGRIMELKQIVPSAVVVKPEDVSTDAVSFGAVVTIRDHTLDEEWDYFLVGPLEADAANDKVSFESPLGAALMGKKVGDVVEAQVPAGTIKMEILAIRPYDPE